MAARADGKRIVSLMDFSVVIPAKDACETLERAVSSTELQGAVKCELLVVNDGSTDDTGRLLNRLSARLPHLRIITNHVPTGVSAARNRAISAARGEWIALLDADDEFLEGRLERLHRLGTSNSLDLVADNLLLKGAAESNGIEAFSQAQMAEGGLFGLGDLLAGDMPGAYAFGIGYCKPIMRRSFLTANALRYDDDIACAEDFLLYAQALAAGARMMFDLSSGYLYSLRDGGHGVAFDLQAGEVNKLIRNQLRRGQYPELQLANKRQRLINDATFRKAIGERHFLGTVKSARRVHPSDLLRYAKERLISRLS